MAKATVEWDDFILSVETKDNNMLLDAKARDTLTEMLKGAVRGCGFHTKDEDWD